MAEKAYVSSRGLQSTQTRLHRSAYAIVLFTVTLGGLLYRELFGEIAFLVVLGAVLVWGVALFIADRPERFKWYRLPVPVIFFVLWSGIALFWARDVTASASLLAIQVVAAALAVIVSYLITWHETLRTFATSLRYLLGGGLLFWVWQTFIAQVTPTAELALLSVIGLTVFGVQTWARLVRPSFGFTWMLVALAALISSNSAVAYGALIVVGISLFFAMWARASSPDSRMRIYWIGLTALAATVTVILWQRERLFPALGFELSSVVEQNIWLDVLREQSVFGLVLFGLLVFVTAWRVWFRAVDQPRRGAGDPLPYAVSALWPFLVMMSLLVFSLVWGSLSAEPSWFVLVLLTVKTRFDYVLPTKLEDARKLAWRDMPLAVSASNSSWL